MSAMRLSALTEKGVDEPYDRTANFRNAPRCGAKNRAGLPCREPALKGQTRCRLHGGWSRGPVTEAGLAHSKAARLKHGYFSEEAINERQEVRELIALVNGTVAAYDVAVTELTGHIGDQSLRELKESLWILYETLTARVREKLNGCPDADTPEAKARHAVRVASWAKLGRVLDGLATAALR